MACLDTLQIKWIKWVLLYFFSLCVFLEWWRRIGSGLMWVHRDWAFRDCSLFCPIWHIHPHTHPHTHTTGFLECPKWRLLTNTYYVHNGRCRLYFSLLGQRAKSLDRGQKHHWAVLFHLLCLRDNVLHKELLCLAATATPHHAFMLIVFHRCLLLNQPPFY